MMSEKELYQQKLQAQLDEWEVKMSQLRAQASGASADAQVEWNQRIEKLEGEMASLKEKLAALGAAGEDTWESLQGDLDSAWKSLQVGLTNAFSK
jgi:predicted nuclease with TOPRIM domain